MDAHSIYLHIPFCQKRCSYCDFNTFEGINHLIPAYVGAITREIELIGLFFEECVPIRTIFFGGGTPSLLNVKQFQAIFDCISESFDLSQLSEVSLEANPGTVNQDYLNSLHDIGFTRISFGVQSLQPHELRLLRRIHSNQDSFNAIRWAKDAGFENINVDLMYGLPNQTEELWMDTLKHVVEMNIQHLSMYALGVEEGTPLADWIETGLVATPDDDLSVDLYESALAYLSQFGFRPYEISNVVKMDNLHDFRCQHNLQYWRNLPYIGVGAGAHGFIKNRRIENLKPVPAYINALLHDKINNDGDIYPSVEKLTVIDRFTEMQETMMLGLRLLEEGVSIPQFIERFGVSPMEVFQKEISILSGRAQLDIIDNKIIRLASGKAMVSNQVLQYFV